jgi:hypothetical protein
MNILSFTKKAVPTRFFAAATILSLVLSALPVSFFITNAAGLYSDVSQTVDSTAEFSSGIIDASNQENLMFSFNFDASKLDATPAVDSFTYGWRNGGGNNDLSTFIGLVGSDVSEVSSISVPLPLSAQVPDLEVYVYVSSDNTSPADEVVLTNIIVTGDTIPVVVEKETETIVVTGDTSAGENQLGWMFNRDANNTTPIEFNEDEAVIGDGALYVLPLSNTEGPRKFIGEYFWQGEIADLDGFSYDFKIGAGGANSDSQQFYLNVYANFGESSVTNFYDCKYNVVPSNGTTGSFETATFDPTDSFSVSDVTTRGSSPYTCPAIPADMNNQSPESTVRAFAINTGDTSLTDADLDGYFDNVVLDTTTKVTIYDFEPAPIVVPGCTDESATNYDPAATEDDGSCVLQFVSQCIDINQNLLINGSFEEPEVTANRKWDKFTVPGWATTKVSDTTPTTLELQRDLFSNEAADGAQYAELDGDHSTKIAQTAVTLDRGTYELSWAFAARHGRAALDNELDILVDSSSVATNGPVTGLSGIDTEDWVTSSYTFQATSNATEIAFADLGPSNSHGTYLDNAQLCLVEEPEPIVSLHTAKIVCTDEADLPNGDIESPITADTATNWLALNPNSSCSLVTDWEFEWGPKTASNPGNAYTGIAGGDWNVFSNSTMVPLSAIGNNNSFWVREVMPEGYIPFSKGGPYGSDKHYTAELNCHIDGVNYDNLDRVDGPIADEDYYCVAWNVPVEKFSDVTMCKVDQNGVELVGWQLALLGGNVGSLVKTTNSAAVQTLSGVATGDYVLKAESSYNYGNGNRFADARFSERKPGDTGYTASQPWREALGSQGLALQVNTDSTLWGSVFSPLHVYYGAFTQNNDNDPIDFYIFDTVYGDNRGSIDLTLHEGFTGITEENGCVTFTDVPYGDYVVEELLQADWTNVSGLGAVTVDSETETFTVENTDVVPQCALAIVSDTKTLVANTNEFAAEASTHGSWTDTIDDATWIWSTERTENPTQDETYTFVETFTVSDPTSALLDIAADNYYKVFVNGSLFLDRSGTPNNYGDLAVKDNQDILSFLISGENTLRIEVTNRGVANNNSVQNPAGVLFRLDIAGDVNSCAVTTEQSSLVITNTDVDGEILSGTHTFEANYQDQDTDEDEVFWAIRAGSCGGTDLVGNTPASPTHPSTFNAVTGAFETTVDMSLWDNGLYCLVVNPREDAGAADERETRTFTLENSVVEPNLFQISGIKWEDVNSDGEIDNSEPAVNGWNIILSEVNGDGTSQQVTTSGNGEYSFTVTAGTWTITEEVQPDWTQTGQYENGELVTSDSQSFGACTFTIAENSTGLYTCSFGNHQDEQSSENPPSTNRSSSGGGTRIERVAQPLPLVLGASIDAPQFCPLLVDYMQIGESNDPMEVKKLQAFLHIFRSIYGGIDQSLTGEFDATTDANVKAFQQHFGEEILNPWYELGIVLHNRPTGFVYKTTLWKINSMVCPDSVMPLDFTGEDLSTNVNTSRDF